MPAPITVSVEVPQSREDVYAFLDVMANHEPFTNHLMKDWSYSGPDRGLGSKAQVHVKAMGVADVIDIEVIGADSPSKIVERNTAQKAGRVGEGTYELQPLPDGGTRIQFTYRWVTAPLLDRFMSPIVRSYLRRANAKAMRRLKDVLASRVSGAGRDSL